MQTKTLGLVKRKIRLAIKEALLNKTLAGQSVFISRTAKLDHEDLPAILIYPNNERVRKFEEAPKSYMRSFGVKIEIVSSGESDDILDQNLEEIAAQVEHEIEVNETGLFNDLIESLELTGAQYSFDPEGQTPLGSLILDFDFMFTAQAIAENDFDFNTLKGADVKWKIGHHNSSPDTGDNLDVDGDGDDGSVKAETKIDLP